MAVIEFRYYLRRLTMNDVEAGVNPVRQIIGGKIVLFAPASLQWRARERIAKGDGAVSMEWGDWADVNYFREGDDASADPAADPPKAA